MAGFGGVPNDLTLEDAEAVRRQAERRVLLPAGPIRLDGDNWRPAGLTADGGLRLVDGPREQVLHRSFGAG